MCHYSIFFMVGCQIPCFLPAGLVEDWHFEAATHSASVLFCDLIRSMHVSIILGGIVVTINWVHELEWLRNHGRSGACC